MRDTVSTSTGTRRGQHLRAKDGGHVLTLVASLANSADEMSRVLVHELVHCRQAEQHGRDWRAAYLAEVEANGYGRSKFEREANRIARELADDLRPVR